MAEDLSTKGRFAFGRHVMTCCVEDIQFAGLMCIYANADDFKTGDWVEITAKVRVEYEEAYGEKGPVLYAKSVKHVRRRIRKWPRSRKTGGAAEP